MTGIYCIKNLITEKRYIGASKNIHNRWIDHRCKLNNHYKGANKDLQIDWDQYGEATFEFSVLEECPVNKLDEQESYWINHYDTTNPKQGYNKSSGGKKPSMSKEFRQSLTGRSISEKTRKKMSQAHKGKTLSEKQKLKISQTLTSKFDWNK